MYRSHRFLTPARVMPNVSDLRSWRSRSISTLIVQLGVLEIHPWGSRVDRINQPDRLIFDMDPAEDVARADGVRAILAPSTRPTRRAMIAGAFPFT